jgi:DNA repair protein RadC
MQYTNSSIKSWAMEDRPREKMLQRGCDALTDAELIAILLATGTREMSAVELARTMLEQIGGFGKVARSSIKELTKIKGIGEVKALTLTAAFELGKRKAREEVFATSFTNSELAARYLIEKIGSCEQEVFYILYLDRKNAIKSETLLSKGTISSTVVDIRLLYKEAVQQAASSIIVAHNHPSGNLTPSQADIDITHKIKEAGKLFDITLLDHVIVSQKGFYSFADNGKI